MNIWMFLYAQPSPKQDDTSAAHVGETVPPSFDDKDDDANSWAGTDKDDLLLFYRPHLPLHWQRTYNDPTHRRRS